MKKFLCRQIELAEKFFASADNLPFENTAFGLSTPHFLQLPFRLKSRLAFPDASRSSFFYPNGVLEVKKCAGLLLTSRTGARGLNKREGLETTIVPRRLQTIGRLAGK